MGLACPLGYDHYCSFGGGIFKPAVLKGLGPECQPEMARGLCVEMYLGRNTLQEHFFLASFFLLLSSFIFPAQRSKGKAVYLQMAV